MSDQPAVETTQEVAVEPATESTGTSTTDIDWKSTLSDDLKNSGSIQSLNTVEDVVKKLVNAEAMIGKDRVILPGKDATPEQWNEFHTKMGRPETIDGYDFSQTETEVSEDSTKQVRDLAFQLGLDKKGGAVLHNALGEAAKRGQDLQKEQIENYAKESMEFFTKEWGQAKDQNMEMAKNAVREFGGDELVEMLDQTGLGNRKEVINAFYKAGRAIAEDGDLIGKTTAGFTKSPGEAKAEIGALKMDDNFMKAYLTKNHSGHKDAVNKMAHLFQLSNPE